MELTEDMMEVVDDSNSDRRLVDSSFNLPRT